MQQLMHLIMEMDNIYEGADYSGGDVGEGGDDWSDADQNYEAITAEGEEGHDDPDELDIDAEESETALDMPEDEQEALHAELRRFVADGTPYASSERSGLSRKLPPDLIESYGMEYDVEVWNATSTEARSAAVGLTASRLTEQSSVTPPDFRTGGVEGMEEKFVSFEEGEGGTRFEAESRWTASHHAEAVARDIEGFGTPSVTDSPILRLDELRLIAIAIRNFNETESNAR